VIVRDARPADVEAIAQLHLQAFAGEIGPMVGLGYLRAFMRWFIETPEAISLVAEADGAIVGYVFGAPDGYGPGLTRTLMPEIVLGVARNLARVVMHSSFRRQVRSRLTNLVLRREPRSTIFEATPQRVFSLVGIGTAPHARGQGVGQALITELCTRADRSVILDVFKDNTAALALYARSGFRPLVTEGRVIRMIRDPGMPRHQ